MKTVFLAITISAFMATAAYCQELENSVEKKDNNYFPEMVFLKRDGKQNDFKVQWYSKHLAALTEESLWEKRSVKDLFVYRFISLPTWSNPTSITFNPNEDGTGMLIVKKTDGHGGYGPGKLVYNKTINLDKNQSNEVLNQFIKINFWKLPTEGGIQGDDGTQWIIEGVKDGQYHVVDRWVTKDSDVYGVGITLLKLAEVES